MAHFAELNSSNEVLRVIVVSNDDVNANGGDQHADAETFVTTIVPHSTGGVAWKQCSYNTHLNTHRLSGTPLRANFPSAGGKWYYDSTNNIFHTVRPTDKDGQSCTSWTMNTTTGLWSSPIARPNETDAELEAYKVYNWDESVYQGNNSQGWVLVDI